VAQGSWATLPSSQQHRKSTAQFRHALFEAVAIHSRRISVQSILACLYQNVREICAYVFHRRGRPIKDFREAWDRACTAVGLEGRIFHDFRRTAV